MVWLRKNVISKIENFGGTDAHPTPYTKYHNTVTFESFGLCSFGTCAMS